MTRDANGAELAFDAAAAALQRAFEQAIAAIEANPDLLQAFEQATEQAAKLGDLGRQCINAAAALRAHAALRLQEREELSLAELGRRLGLSKARADQLVKKARQQRAANGAS